MNVKSAQIFTKIAKKDIELIKVLCLKKQQDSHPEWKSAPKREETSLDLHLFEFKNYPLDNNASP